MALPPAVLPAASGRVSVKHVGGSDALLAARLAAGDDRALGEVFDCLGPAVHGAALRVLRDEAAAQDVVQDVFVELWSRPGRYDPAVGTLHAYLVVLARHRAIDLARSELRRVARQERSCRLTPGEPAPLICEQVMAAQAAGIPEGTAKSRLRLALAKLGHLIEPGLASAR
jgi:RNA polymerase sigma-70 factor, ECF subfamily